MEKFSLKCPWIEEDLTFQSDKKVQISVVAYEHPLGMPARFCIGLVPAIALYKQLESREVLTVIRLIDPTSIANYCNGWEKSRLRQFRDVIVRFLNDHNVHFFFDESEPVTDTSLEVLRTVGRELESATDQQIAEMVQRIKESGKKHGGDLGAENAILYMAAHPFSWLDMHHSSVWRRQYSTDDYQYINLMSKPESRFTVVRKFLRQKRQQLSTAINMADHYMTVCNTPCYIPLENEPTFTDLTNLGYDFCHKCYRELKGESGNHRRALKDFELLRSFLGHSNS